MTDSFELSSGLVEDFDGTIVDAFFGFDAAYNNGGTCVLKIEVKPDEPDLFGGNNTTLLYTVGENYEPADNGKRVVHNSGREKHFNKQSGIGLLIASVADIDGGLDLLRSKGTAFDAGIWVGLHAEFYGKEFSGKVNGEDRTWSRTLIRSIGEGSGASQGEPAEVNYGIDPVLKGKLKAIAAEVADHDAFIEKAFSELTLDGDTEALVVDADFYQDLKGS